LPTSKGNISDILLTFVLRDILNLADCWHIIFQISILSNQMVESSPIPKLSTTHSGVPARLSNEAEAAKEKIYSLRTLPNSVPRQSPVRLPPGVTRVEFKKAIHELRRLLGGKAVELNNKPLVDGWYMEHP
jgi:hypothetical protein